MSKFTEELRDLQIYNGFGFYNQGEVYISYSPAISGRGSRFACWKVYRKGHETDPDAHFRDFGNKIFNVWARGTSTHKESKDSTLEEAKQWAEEKYGLQQEWIKDPFGGWGGKTYVKARIAALKTALKTLPFRTGDSVLVGGEGEIRIICGLNGEGKIMLEGDPQGIRAIHYESSELTKVGC